MLMFRQLQMNANLFGGYNDSSCHNYVASRICHGWRAVQQCLKKGDLESSSIQAPQCANRRPPDGRRWV